MQKLTDMAASVVEIRSRFIQNNLSRALNGPDHVMAWVTASEFRRYFHWMAELLPEKDRRIIADQLRQLEQRFRSPQSGISAHPDRVRHQLQETAFAE